MSCGCENKRLGQELERARRLAKNLAVMENETVAIYRNEDGSYRFNTINEKINKPIIEYITPY